MATLQPRHGEERNSFISLPRQYLVPRTNIWQMENVSNVTGKIISCSYLSRMQLSLQANPPLPPRKGAGSKLQQSEQGEAGEKEALIKKQGMKRSS